MPQNTWSGTIAYIGEPTVDNREIELLHVDDLPLPLLELRTVIEGHHGAEVCGIIEDVHLPQGPGAVTGHGYTRLEPGEYSVGVDLSMVRAGRRNPLAMRGVLIGTTVYPEGHAGAFPDARITVVAP